MAYNIICWIDEFATPFAGPLCVMSACVAV